MAKVIISTIFSVLLGILGIAFLVCIVALAIIYLSRYSAFFMKLYMFFFQREDYDVYREGIIGSLAETLKPFVKRMIHYK